VSKRYRQSSRPAGFEPVEPDSPEKRQSDRERIAKGGGSQKVTSRAVGLPPQEIGREAYRSKKELREERRSGVRKSGGIEASRDKRPRCKCGAKATVTRASLSEGAQHWCNRCFGRREK
jgi:hypothetical protein